jgi:thiol-disulfide isomerase/thioredoxin
MGGFLEDRQVLYFIYGQGCGACEEAAPHLDAFVKKHKTLMVVRLDAGGPHPGRLGLRIKATPSYVFRIGEQGVLREGAMTEGELGDWVKALTDGDFDTDENKPKRKRTKREPVESDETEEPDEEEDDEDEDEEEDAA